jgi:quinol-cytochrome oxidoreductase complex cytochrome b subunit
MYTKFLDNPREISLEEKIEIKDAISKWYPSIVQTYNTSILDLMASPIKKGIVHGIIVFIIISIFLLFDYNFKVLNLKFSKHPVIFVIFLVIILFIIGITVYGQHIKNENLKLVLSLTKRGAT